MTTQNHCTCYFVINRDFYLFIYLFIIYLFLFIYYYLFIRVLYIVLSSQNEFVDNVVIQ